MPAPLRTIDAHHHLWRYTPTEFDWLDGPLEPLRRDFLGPELEAAMRSAGVDAAIAVQARQTLEETAWLLDQAAALPGIAGVVGWAPLASPQFPAVLERLRVSPRLRGLRHVVQSEPDGFLAGADFNRGLHALAFTGLVYDILVVERQLPQAIAFVDRHPTQSFVLDHIAKPRIAASVLEPWATHLRELARRPNVSCKLSGMITEADPAAWTSGQLMPYLEIALEAFGPTRLMAGSDWPVCLAGVAYDRWFALLRHFCTTLSTPEREAIFGATAERIYHLA